MSTTLADPRGIGGNAYIQENALDVNAFTEGRGSQAAKLNQDSFVWTSTYSTGAANQVHLYIKNTSATKRLVIRKIHVGGGTAIGIWTLYRVTGGTVAGTAIAEQSTVTKGLVGQGVADDVAYGSASVTGLVYADVLGYKLTLAGESADMPLDDVLMLEPGGAIAIASTINGTIVYVTALGHFEKIDV